MRITVNVEDAAALSDGVWAATMEPSSVRNLAPPLSQIGGTTIVLIEETEFDATTKHLSFPLGSTRVLNLGSTSAAILVSAADAEMEAGASRRGAATSAGISTQAPRLGFGDRECLREVERLGSEIAGVGRQLVEHIRGLDPSGDLRHEGRRFINRSDNFVTLQPQPRVGEILVTIRGIVETKLKRASAVRGYSGFKVGRPTDLAEAQRVISAATRRK